jgi:glycosyltransferase involved in cell wall biosynthesis
VVNSAPAVSVIIPTYNWSTVLPYSVGSVLDQTFTDFELLVIGDSCTDDSAEVVAAIDDRRVQWHNLEVRVGHQSGPNNHGIDRARGSVIAYLGHDDLWLPRHLEILVAAVAAGAGMAYARTLLVAPDQPPRAVPAARSRYKPGRWIPPTAVGHERSLALDVGGWRLPRETGIVDPETELWKRMAAAGRPPTFVPQLTSVKLPAAYRRDVYRLQPNHEQAAWLARIRETDNPERALLEGHAREPRFTPHLYGLWARFRHLMGLPPATVSAEDRARSTRRYKGVED